MTSPNANSMTNDTRPEVADARVYKLVILFDGSQVSRDGLQEKAEKALDQVPNKKLTVRKEGARHLSLCIAGSLDVVDQCHAELSDNLLSRPGLRHRRMRDEAGDEVRLRAYPILSAVEQQMRAFINSVWAEVFGFEDWKSNVPEELQPKITQTSKPARKTLSLDPLESTDFADLLDWLQARFSTWSPNRPLTPTDMAELLAKSGTLDELRARLAERTKVVSVWDDVFARYFKKPEDKENLRAALDFVVKQRNKVMHHRPVRLGMLTELRKKGEQIDALLKSAKKELTPKERAEARADGERTQQVLSAWSRLRDMQLQSAQLDPKFVGMFQEAFSSPHTSLAKMADEMLRVDPKLVEMLDRTRQQAFALSEPSFAQMLKQTQSADLAFRKAWSPEMLRQLAAASEAFRSADLLMADARKPYFEALMRERDRMADVMKPYFEILMRERDRSVENHGSPAVPRSEPEGTESKRAQKDEDDKRIPS